MNPAMLQTAFIRSNVWAPLQTSRSTSGEASLSEMIHIKALLSSKTSKRMFGPELPGYRDREAESDSCPPGLRDHGFMGKNIFVLSLNSWGPIMEDLLLSQKYLFLPWLLPTKGEVMCLVSETRKV